MGDHANVEIRDEGSVFLYTHWRGTRLPITVQQALTRGQDRWTDGPYLARIIFSEMIRDEIDQNTGYGISTYAADGDDRIVIVYIAQQMIKIKGHTWTFAEYVKAPTSDLDWDSAEIA